MVKTKSKSSVADSRSSGRAIVTNRVSIKTKVGYDSKLNHLIDYMYNHDETRDFVHVAVLENGKEQKSINMEDVTIDIVEGWLGAMGEPLKQLNQMHNASGKNGVVDPEQVEEMAMLIQNMFKSGSVQGYISGLKDAFKRCDRTNRKVPPDIDGFCNEFVRAYTIMEKSLQDDGVLTFKEGKSYMKFDGYQLLAKTFMKMVLQGKTRLQINDGSKRKKNNHEPEDN